MVGGLIMAHGDDDGLLVPPALAPTQCVVVLVKDDEGAGDVAAKLVDDIKANGVRVRLDSRVDVSFGRRATDWELKGVPVRVEVGPRDLADGNVTLVRRDSREKLTTPLDGAALEAAALTHTMQADILDTAEARRDARVADCATLDDAREAAQVGFARVPWSVVGVKGEAELAEAAVSVRCLQRPDGSMPADEDEPDLVAYVARAY
jgi:prolyl-tRNA synthetase